MTSFLIAGYYGFGNLGDEAILASLLDGLKKSFPGVELTVLSGVPERTKSLHGVNAVLWTDIGALASAAKAADVFLVGGGGLFADYWPIDQQVLLTDRHLGIVYYVALPLLARALGKRSAIIGVGVGPLASEEAKTLVRLAFDEADVVTVRSVESKALLETLGVRGAKVSVTTDPAFALRPRVALEAIDGVLKSFGVPADRPLLPVSLRHWEREVSAEHWEGAVARGLDLYIGKIGAHAIFLPFQREADPEEDDVAVARRVHAKMQRRDDATVLPAPLPPDVTGSIIARARTVLAMRFHAAVFAVGAGIEPVALAYDPKLDRLMRRAGIERSLLKLNELDPQRIAAALEVTRSAPSLAPFAEQMAKLAAENITAVVEVAALPKRAPDPAARFLAEQLLDRSIAYGTIAVEHRQALHQLLVRDSQLASLKRDLASITESKTYRLAERIRDLSYRAVPKGTRRQAWMQSALRTAKETRALGVRGTAKRYLPAPVQEPLLSAYHGLKELAQKDRRAEDRRQLRALIEKHRGARDIWVLAPSIPWDIALFQRPQQLAMALARLGVVLFYVDPHPKPNEHGFVEQKERIYIARVDRDVFSELEDFTSYVLSWNKAWTDRLHPKRVVYDFIDDLDVFNTPDPEQLKRDHQTLLAEATVVSATAELLWREVSAARKDAILCPNGVDYAHFAAAKDPALPAPDDLQEIWSLKKPVIGYYGAIARWFDYDLLWAVASKRPDLFFLLIGPDYDQTLRDQSAFALPNVKWVGPRHYSVLPRYLKRFDVATIPFKLNAITHATSPLKLFEYMAGGKPIVTTPMKESMRYENVLVGDSPETFSEKLSQALALRSDPTHLALTDRLARANTWDARAEQLLDALHR